MNSYLTKRIMPIISIVILLVCAQLSWAQDFDASPQLRSYLQKPVTETGQYIQDVSIPSITSYEGIESRLDQPTQLEQLSIPGYSEILIDKKIDPDLYIVGPGDNIQIYMWGELDRDYTVRITPEGKVLIPTVGPVMVADFSLTEASNIIKDAVNKSYKGLDVTVSLIEPRRFRVYISGVVERPGMYNAHALMRVSDLLEDVRKSDLAENATSSLMNQQNRQYQRQQQTTTTGKPFLGNKAGLISRGESANLGEKKGSSKRSIILHHGDIKTPVDLLRFEKLGNIDDNPYVSGGDNIEVTPYIGDILVTGEVNTEGIFEFKPGDRIADLVRFGGGLTSVADTLNAKLVRFSDDGHDIRDIVVDLYDALVYDPDNPAYLLKESDRLFIQTKYEYKILANVIVEGQVKYPGEYAITPNDTKLSDIIRMAGGFTEYANLEEARIIRPQSSALTDLEYDRLRMMEVADMSDEEYEYFKHRSRTLGGLITINFVKLFKENDMSHDIMLESNDNIFVPLKRELVNVLGAVIESGYVGALSGQNVEYFIEKAGGYNWNANTRGVRIIKAKTGQRLKKSRNVVIEGGDTILVPEKREIAYWEIFRDTMAVLADVTTLVIISRNVFK